MSMSWKTNINTCMWGQHTRCAWGREGREEDERTEITCIHEASPVRHGLPLIKNIFIFLSSLATIRVWDSNKCCVSFHPASHSINEHNRAQMKAITVETYPYPLYNPKPANNVVRIQHIQHLQQLLTVWVHMATVHGPKYPDSAAAQLRCTTGDMVDILAEQVRAERGVHTQKEGTPTPGAETPKWNEEATPPFQILHPHQRHTRYLMNPLMRQHCHVMTGGSSVVMVMTNVFRKNWIFNVKKLAKTVRIFVETEHIENREVIFWLERIGPVFPMLWSSHEFSRKTMTELMTAP